MAALTCCVTGQRRFPTQRADALRQALRRELDQAVADGYTCFLSGFSGETDLIFAELVAERKREDGRLSLEAALAYRGALQQGGARLRRLILHCNAIGVHGASYSPAGLQRRDRFLVDSAQRVLVVCAAGEGSDPPRRGSAAYALRCARALGREARIVWV